MKLTDNFTYEEMSATEHADLQAINRNEAGPFMANLLDLASFLLEPIRAEYGAFHIDSAFRGPELNAKVGGVPTSQHCQGQAADISRKDWTWDALDGVANWIKKESDLKFGQCIREIDGARVWLHISTGTKCEAEDHKAGGEYTLRP